MTESWWLKLQRADHHLKEVDESLRAYESKHPYQARQIPHPNGDPNDWRYVLEVTEPPDESLPIVIGDEIHNMRSALDHLLVTMRPRKYRYLRGFPILTDDPWDGRPTPRKAAAIAGFDEAVKGLSWEAVALVKTLQPYHDKADGREPLHNALSVMCHLDNRDKHREPILTVPGVLNVTTVVTARDEQLVQRHAPRTSGGYPGLVVEGTEVAHFRWSKTPPLSATEVTVEVSGIPLVAVDVGIKDSYMEVRDVLANTMRYLWEEVVPALESHLPRRS